jgi:hypothetical protein
MKQIVLFIVFFAFLSGCVEQYDLKLDKVDASLVVEALITNQKGPYYVRLTKSITGSFTTSNKDTLNDIVPIMDALVIVSDDSGQIDTLKIINENLDEYLYDYQLGYYKILYNESGQDVDTLFYSYPESFNRNGYYKTTTLKGMTGHTYSLKVVFDHKEYLAKSYMPEVPDIDSISYREKIMEKDNSTYFIPIIYFKDPQNSKNYYLIQLKEDIQLRSGYDPQNWEISILSDEFLEPYVNGLYISLGANPRGMNYPFYNYGDSVYVGLSSLTKEAYDYYKCLLEQFDSDGGAYKPSPASPPSNISNGGLGFFRTSSISEMCIKINDK